MKTFTKKLWKHMKRHPLSAEYRDITGPAWMRFCLRMKHVGYLKDRPIYLHEDMVIDGWQRLRASIETNTEPVFAEMPKGITPEEFVETVNDERRHETAEEATERIEARRKRVAEARVEGKSTRAIAEEVGVSQPTVLNDIAVATDKGLSVEPPDGKVTGKDDKKRDAKKPVVLCKTCSHNQDVGKPIRENCESCAEARGQKKAKPEKEPKAGKPRFDEKKFDAAYGSLVRVIDERGNLMGKGAHHKKCQDIMGDFIDTYKLWKKESE